MRPVAEKYRKSQSFGAGATQGIVPDSDPASGWPYYVWLYGNYQPLGHAGLDIACPVGTPIHAIADGTVIYAGWSEDLPGAPNNIRKWLFYYNFGGILTLIQHDGWISVIAHQSNNNHVKVGQKVKEGQLIGLSGDTKTKTTKVAPHVHVEAIVDLSYRSTGGLIYGRTDPELFFGSAAIAPQGETKTGGLSVADIDTISKQLADIQDKLGPINTTAGPVSVRQMIADGARSAQRAEEQTGPINVSGGQEGIRDFIAKGTRAAQSAAAQIAGLEAALQAVIKAAGSPVDLAAVTAAAEAGATKALSNLKATTTLEQGK